MDNSNVQKKERRVGPPLSSTHVWAFTSVYYISHGVLSGFSASPLMFMKIGQVERENLNATKLGQCKAGNLANKKSNHLKIIVPCVNYYIMCKFAIPCVLTIFNTDLREFLTFYFMPSL
jgi:hypothetical protein